MILRCPRRGHEPAKPSVACQRKANVRHLGSENIAVKEGYVHGGPLRQIMFESNEKNYFVEKRKDGRRSRFMARTQWGHTEESCTLASRDLHISMTHLENQAESPVSRDGVMRVANRAHTAIGGTISNLEKSTGGVRFTSRPTDENEAMLFFGQTQRVLSRSGTMMCRPCNHVTSSCEKAVGPAFVIAGEKKVTTWRSAIFMANARVGPVWVTACAASSADVKNLREQRTGFHFPEKIVSGSTGVLPMETSMEITINEFFDAIQGKASRMNGRAVAAEVENPDSLLHAQLLEVETWARTGGAVLPNDPAKPLLPEGDARDIKRSRFARARSLASDWACRPEAAIIGDYLRCLDKSASNAAVVKVSSSLNNPSSVLSRLLNDVSAAPPATAVRAVDQPPEESDSGTSGGQRC